MRFSSNNRSKFRGAYRITTGTTEAADTMVVYQSSSIWENNPANHRHRNAGRSWSADLVRLTTSLSLSIAVLSLTLVRNNNTTVSRMYEFCRSMVFSFLDRGIQERNDSDRRQGTGRKSRGRRQLLGDGQSESNKADDRTITKHKGSCHCAAVAFQVSSFDRCDCGRRSSESARSYAMMVTTLTRAPHVSSFVLL